MTAARRGRGGAHRGVVAGLVLPRVRDDAVVLAAVALVAVVASGVLAALPRVVDRLADASLAGELEDAPVVRRSIRVEALVPPPTGGGDDPLAELRDQGWEALEAAGPLLRAALEAPRLVIDLPRYQLEPLPGQGEGDGNVQMLTMRIQDGVEEQLEVVAGRLPGRDVGELRTSGEVLDLHEVVVTAATAEQLGLELGDRVRATPDVDDAVARRSASFSFPTVAIEVVGLIELSDPDDGLWFEDPRLHRPSRYDTGVATTFFGFGLVTADGLDGLPRGDASTPFSATWHFGIGPGAIDAATVDRLNEEVRRLEAATTTVASPGVATVHTSLGALLDREVERRTVATDTLSLAGLALAGVALALVALASGLTVVRRRRTTALVRARGGSTGQLLTAQALEAALVLVPAGLLGWVAAAVLVPQRGAGPASALAVAGFVAAAATLQLVVAAAELRRPLAEVFDDTEGTPVRAPARRAGEVLLAVLAVVGAVLLRERGVEAGAGADVLVVATPVVIALAGGVLVARLYRLPVGWARRRASGRRGVVAVAGLTRARDPRLAPGVAVVVLAVAVGVLATGLAAGVERGQDDVAWQQVGAPLRVDAPVGGTLAPELLDVVREVAGADAAVAAVHRTRNTVRYDGGSTQVDVVVADLGTLAATSAGSPVAFQPDPDLAASDTSRGEVVPAVAARAAPGGGRTAVGDRLTVRVGTGQLDAEVVQVLDRLPAAGLGDTPWIVLPRDLVHTALDDDLRATGVAVAAPADRLASVEEAVGSAGVAVQRTDAAAALRDQPLAAGVVTGFRAVGWLAALGASAGLLTVVVLTDRARQRDLALLGALGAEGRRRRGVVAVELVPTTLAATAAGLATGVVLVVLVGRALDLVPFVGGAVPASPPADTLLHLGVGATLAAAVLVVVAAWWPRSLTPDRTLRGGDAS